MTRFIGRFFSLLAGLVLLIGCSRETPVSGTWSRDDDAMVMELLGNNTGTVIADNVKIFNKKGIPFTSDIQLKQTIKCKWSLQDGNTLIIEETDSASHNIMKLKLEGQTLTRDGKVLFTKKST